MGFRVRTNTGSSAAIRSLSGSTRAVQDTATRMASGSKINKAADNAAGLAVSENLRADVRSLLQARRNSLDGISLIQTAEGGLVETGNIIVRLRELAIQGASDTIGQAERYYIDNEFSALTREIDRIARTTEFNGSRVLLGGADLPAELETVFSNSSAELQVSKDYYSNADSLDSENPVNIIRVSLQKMNASATGANSLDLNKSTEGEVLDGIKNKVDAQKVVARMDKALSKISGHRAILGALQVHLMHATQNLGVQVENLDSAKSRISDADYAEETAKYTKFSILQQSTTSLLAQANNVPRGALRLMEMLS